MDKGKEGGMLWHWCGERCEAFAIPIFLGH